jgi:hypothetical protein
MRSSNPAVLLAEAMPVRANFDLLRLRVLHAS